MIDIAFIWHMHQPYYKDDSKGLYMLPWARLHGVKDYYPMAAMVERYEKMKATFNMVPVLLEQINDYVNNGASDTFLELTLKKPGGMTGEEKARLLDDFFKVNFKRFVEPHPRYRDILIKKGISNITIAQLRKAAGSLDDADYLDLQVLFNLAWFHSTTIESDQNLREIVAKEEGYTEADKSYVVEKQREVLSGIIPLCRRLQDAGKIEITTTPYYHPILPLLCDTEIARVSVPDIKLPRPKFSHPEDARWQLESAMRYHKECFGRPARGMWPSEGSISEEVLDLMIGVGLDWVVTDEEILLHTMSAYDKSYRARPIDRRLIYEPYRFEKESRHISMVFRDKNLSNLISFAYAEWDQAMAAMDLLEHFRRISENMRRETDMGLVTIVMDGENAWEHFEDNGRRFFEVLYSNLDNGNGIRSSTVSDYLKIEPARRTLKNIYPGSWIDHNFKIWIGSPQDNLAWQYLNKARRDLLKFTNAHKDRPSPNIEKAWREIYIAEGSDWNWWYGPEHKPGYSNPFDSLFRAHLRNVYRFTGMPVPDYLKEPII